MLGPCKTETETLSLLCSLLQSIVSPSQLATVWSAKPWAYLRSFQGICEVTLFYNNTESLSVFFSVDICTNGAKAMMGKMPQHKSWQENRHEASY